MNHYIINTPRIIHLPESASNPVITEILGRYTRGLPWQAEYDSEDFVISIGSVLPMELEDGEFVLKVAKEGVYIAGRNYGGMMRGLFAFLERIVCFDKLLYKAECCELRESPAVGFRGVHLCIFPETSIVFLEKCIRTAAASRYSHVILEFWGTIRLDSFPEMAWPFAFGKEEIRGIIERGRALGLEFIPMLQHLGHAAMARQGASGKHVVLDQFPELEYLYLPGFYGWVWDYRKPAVRGLLRNIRDELCELCGDGGWFMLGCDEADDLGHGPDSLEVAAELCEFLNGIQEDLASKGRRAVMWGDMLLCAADMPIENRAAGEYYSANSSREFSQAMLNGLSRDIVIADWQYEIVTDKIWQSSGIFSKQGFEVICCSFSNQANYDTALNTIKAYNLTGFMKTTWHTINRQIPHLVYVGEMMWYGRRVSDYGKVCSKSTDIFRKVMPCPDYENAGWSKIQIGPGANVLA